MVLKRYRAHEDRQRRRQRVDRLLALAEYLSETDRLLVEHVYRHGHSLTELARTVNQKPRALQARLAKLVKHIDSSDFLILFSRGHLMSSATRTVAMRVVVQRMSMRQASQNLRKPLSHVRRHLAEFRRVCDEEWSQAKNPPQGKSVPPKERFHKF